MKNLLIVLLFPLLLVSFGCRETPLPLSPTETAVRNQVVAYTALLAEGYETLSMNHLLQVATEERAMKAFYHMAALGEARVRMIAVLEKINFAEVAFPDDSQAQVRTSEKWSYQYRDVDTDAERFTNHADYSLLYTLLRRDGVWLVAEVEVVEATEEKSAHELERFFQRPASDPLPTVIDKQKRELEQ